MYRLRRRIAAHNTARLKALNHLQVDPRRKPS